MCDSYPNYKPMDLSETIDVWTMMLEEYTYEQISVALKQYVLTENSGFAPSIGQLVNIALEQKKQKYFADLEKMLLENSYKAQIQEKRDFAIKSSLEDKNTLKIENNSVGIPKHIEEKLQEMRCAESC